MSDPPQDIPVGELDTEKTVHVDREYSRESVRIRALAWSFLSTALKSKSEKELLAPVNSPRETWDVFLA